MSNPVLVILFVAGALVSLSASWMLVSRLERIGASLGLSESLLGMVAALAADAPEITASVTALADHQARVGAGVVIGSNVFNLAALLGLAAVVAGRITLHRRVVVLEGVVAVWIATACLLVIRGVLPVVAGLIIVLAVFAPYVVVLGIRRDRLFALGLPPAWARWLTRAIVEEEVELEVAIHPRPGGRRDVLQASVATLIVVGASVGMEQAATTFGSRVGIAPIIIGGLVLAAVTSVPNAVAAVYLAMRGRAAACLSTAMNSNALNVIAGLLIPATIVGIGAPSGRSTLITATYLGLTVCALGCAYSARGLRRRHGAIIIAIYLAFAGALCLA